MWGGTMITGCGKDIVTLLAQLILCLLNQMPPCTLVWQVGLIWPLISLFAVLIFYHLPTGRSTMNCAVLITSQSSRWVLRSTGWIGFTSAVILSSPSQGSVDTAVQHTTTVLLLTANQAIPTSSRCRQLATRKAQEVCICTSKLFWHNHKHRNKEEEHKIREGG
ncbi:uncharacterized protein LOC126354958 [Schistocerca gregaria]|uniref:uncharacterized protein LOC126354958 n=1 Tax=Schistocerca gregaria TaxID=7010 RepID=UPI00211EB034|nr:uncharacterized protein LOC126354958 [Schistocerca gregaria]